MAAENFERGSRRSNNNDGNNVAKELLMDQRFQHRTIVSFLALIGILTNAELASNSGLEVVVEGAKEISERIMKVIYDTKVDVIRILFNSEPIEESETVNPGFILDYDKDGNVVGMEILHASKRIEDPRSIEYTIAG